MTELKAGPELDRAVAKAIGWKYRLADGCNGEIFGLTCWHTPEGQQHHGYPPQFSTDLNTVFAAAEKTWRQFAVQRLMSGKYEVSVYDDGFSRFDEQPTPALAICAAILATKGYDLMHGDLDAIGGLSEK